MGVTAISKCLYNIAPVSVALGKRSSLVHSLQTPLDCQAIQPAVVKILLVL